MLNNVDFILGKTYTLFIKVVDFRRNNPVKNVNVKVYRLETKPIAPEQWAENLKNGAPFKTLILSTNTDDNGVVTGTFPEGTYEAKIEQLGLHKVCVLTQNVQVVFTEPKKHWW